MCKQRLIAIAVLFSLCGHYAHAQIDLNFGKPRKGESICLNAGIMRDFTSLSSKHILFRYDAKNYYLMTMKRGCFGLLPSSRLYPKSSGKVCPKRRDEIAYEDKLGRVESCIVDTIDHVQSRDAAKALIEERKEAKRKKKDED